MSDDVDPTGDRTWRGDEEQPITAKRVLAEDQSAEVFSDLRYEVALAARRHTEISTALDIYADELSHIAFAVVGDRDGITGFDQIVDHVKAVVAERDRLKSVVEHAVETLSESASGAPGVLATVDLMRLALDPTGEDT
jgi:hypothetical protein